MFYEFIVEHIAQNRGFKVRACTVFFEDAIIQVDTNYYKIKSMNRNVGMWIDHREAVIVRITDNVEEMHSIESGVEKHVHYSGGQPEDQQEHRFTNHLNEYYDKVIAYLHDANSLLVFGPGEAKGELEKRLSATSFSGQIVGTETKDKMTHHQIAAKVREYFLNPAGELQPGNNAKHTSNDFRRELKGQHQ